MCNLGKRRFKVVSNWDQRWLYWKKLQDLTSVKEKNSLSFAVNFCFVTSCRWKWPWLTLRCLLGCSCVLQPQSPTWIKLQADNNLITNESYSFYVLLVRIKYPPFWPRVASSISFWNHHEMFMISFQLLCFISSYSHVLEKMGLNKF